MRIMTLFILTFLFVTETYAVPVPWKNCGTVDNIVSVSKLDSNVWPPQNTGPTGPVFVTARVNPVLGKVLNLRVVLFPLNWVFELFNIDVNIRVKNGFVTLPDSWRTSGSPRFFLDLKDLRGLPFLGPTDGYLDQLPIPLGPFSNLVTLPYGGDPSTRPFIMQIKANIAEAIPQMEGRFWMTFNGVSGFPASPSVGAYMAHLSITGPNGKGVFCMELTEPTKFDTTAVAVVERVPLAHFKTISPNKANTDLIWSYGDNDEKKASDAMDPRVEIRSCSHGEDSIFEEVDLLPEYNSKTAVWSLGLSKEELSSGCNEVRIRSALTGQVDGPFRIE